MNRSMGEPQVLPLELYRGLTPKTFPQTIVFILGIGLLAFWSARFAGIMVLRPEMLWPLWPGCALIVAIMLLTPRRLWPVSVGAGITGFVLYDLQTGLSLQAISLFILSDIAEIVVAAIGVSLALRRREELYTTHGLIKYLLVAGIVAPLVPALIGPSATGGNRVYIWKVYFLTESLALALVTPTILGWADFLSRRTPQSGRRYLEGLLLPAGLVVVGYVTFVLGGEPQSPALLYSLVPFLLWAALRFGLTGVCSSMLIIAFFSVRGAVHGHGPFTESSSISNVLALQLFLLFSAVPFMFLAVRAQESKKADAAVRESEKRFRLVANTAPVMIWMSGTDKLCNYFNERWLDFTGRTFEEETGNGWSEGVHKDDVAQCLDSYMDAFDRREEFKIEYRLRRWDGEYRWISDIGIPRYDSDGSFAGYIGSCSDVTDAKLADERIQEANERLRLAMESGAIGGWEWDAASDTVRWFAETCRQLGLPCEQHSARAEELWNKVHPDDLPELRKAFDNARQTHTEFSGEFRVVWPDGTIHWLRCRGKYMYGDSGEAVRMLGSSVETTEHKRAEEALRESEERLRLALQIGKMFAYTWDKSTDMVERKGGSARILGIEDTIPITGAELIANAHRDDRERLESAISNETLAKPDLQIQYRVVRPDGEEVWVERKGRAYLDENGKRIRVVGLIADITESKRAQEILQNMSGRLIEAQEAERARIARDLHDDIGQRLALLTVRLEQMKETGHFQEANTRTQMIAILDDMSELATNIHNLSHQLHSSSLEHLGVVVAMRRFCKDISRQHAVEIDFRYHDVPGDLSGDISLCLFRVLQEALQNAVKHSGVRHFAVEIWSSSHHVFLTVADHGIGFDLKSASQAPGLGLMSMQERLRLVHGQLSIESEPDKGTLIRARVPLTLRHASMRAAG